MSNELKPELHVQVGAPVQVFTSWRPAEENPARITKVGRVWFTVHAVGHASDLRFRIDDLKPHDENYAWRVTNEEIVAYELRVRTAWNVLENQGLQKRIDKPALHDEDLFAIAELLAKRIEGGE